MCAGKVVSVKWQPLWNLGSIPGINEDRKLSLEKAGILTLRSLTEASAEHVARAIRADYAETARLRAKASAFLQQDIVLLRNFSLPVKNRAYINFEICGAEERIRLIGLHLETEDRTQILFAETPEEEKQILGEVSSLLQPGAGFNLICYSVSLWQRQLLSRRLAFHGLPIGLARSIRDIFFEVEDCFAFPIARLGLTQIAEWCGFKPHTANAMHGVTQLCNPTQKLTKSQKRVLLRSSEQNLLALRHVVLYLERLAQPQNPSSPQQPRR
jgi:predicted RecB family nuclease